MVLLVYSHLEIVLFFRNCSILSSTPSATFSSTPSVSLLASTAATLSSTSSLPPSHLQIVPLLLLPSLLFPSNLTLLCHLLLVRRLQIVPLFLLLPLLLFLFQLPLFCHLLLVLLPPHNIFSFLFFSFLFPLFYIIIR